jgi:hypothetical protein
MIANGWENVTGGGGAGIWFVEQKKTSVQKCTKYCMCWLLS